MREGIKKVFVTFVDPDIGADAQGNDGKCLDDLPETPRAVRLCAIINTWKLLKKHSAYNKLL